MNTNGEEASGSGVITRVVSGSLERGNQRQKAVNVEAAAAAVVYKRDAEKLQSN